MSSSAYVLPFVSATASNFVRMLFSARSRLLVLTQAEVEVYIHQQVDPCPEEACFGPPVPCRRIQLAVRDDIHKGEVDDVVGVPGQDDRFGPESRRGNLRHDGVDNRRDGEISCGRQQENHGPCGPGGCCRRVRGDAHPAGDAGGCKC